MMSLEPLGALSHFLLHKLSRLLPDIPKPLKGTGLLTLGFQSLCKWGPIVPQQVKLPSAAPASHVSRYQNSSHSTFNPSACDCTRKAAEDGPAPGGGPQPGSAPAADVIWENSTHLGGRDVASGSWISSAQLWPGSEPADGRSISPPLSVSLPLK